MWGRSAAKPFENQWSVVAGGWWGARSNPTGSVTTRSWSVGCVGSPSSMRRDSDSERPGQRDLMCHTCQQRQGHFKHFMFPPSILNPFKHHTQHFTKAFPARPSMVSDTKKVPMFLDYQQNTKWKKRYMIYTLYMHKIYVTCCSLSILCWQL